MLLMSLPAPREEKQQPVLGSFLGVGGGHEKGMREESGKTGSVLRFSACRQCLSSCRRGGEVLAPVPPGSQPRSSTAPLLPRLAVSTALSFTMKKDCELYN